MHDAHMSTLESLLARQDFPPDAFRLDERLRHRDIVLYGAGECSHWFTEVVMRIHGLRPVLVLDRAAKPGDTFEGVPVRTPVNFHPSRELQEEAVVVIALGKQEYVPGIRKDLQALGFRHIIHIQDVYEIHNPFSLPPALEQAGFRFYLENRSRIMEALALFEEEESRSIYTAFLQTHLTRKPVFLPRRPRTEQYFPTDIPLTRGHGRYVCCGADTGDTLRLLHETCGKVEAIACFEPEPALFQGLAAYLQEASGRLAGSVIAMPCAVYSHDGLAPFTSANHDWKRDHPTGYGSRVLAGGESRIQCVTLDHALPGFHPTLISMDIEGAELEALRGAVRTVRACRPDLAISVYHAPDHIWEIPLFLKDICPDYRFHLRNHTGFTYETVLYAAC
jgi:FkbM family methyltransferase